MKRLKFFHSVMVGPPGSGKGTISRMFTETFGVQHISSGDLLRLSTSQSPSLQSAMKQGKLISNEMVEKVVFPELKQHTHWLLDGFPRTLMQAESLMRQYPVDVVINLNVPDETIIDRLRGRWIHVASGRIYHSLFNPPKVAGVDDISGEPLEQRVDDQPMTVQRRLDTYHKEINPVLNYFEGFDLLKTYTGTESKALWPEVHEDIKNIIEKRLRTDDLCN